MQTEIWGVQILDWDDDSLRPKDLIGYNTHDRVFATLEKAKEWAAVCAKTQLAEYHEGLDTKPNVPLRWEEEKSGSSGPSSWRLKSEGHEDGVAYDHDEAGFWVLVYPMILQS